MGRIKSTPDGDLAPDQEVHPEEPVLSVAAYIADARLTPMIAALLIAEHQYAKLTHSAWDAALEALLNRPVRR